MHRAVHRLILRREQLFDLLVGLVDGTGAPGLFVGLAAQAQRRLGKALPFAFRLGRRAAHWFLSTLGMGREHLPLL